MFYRLKLLAKTANCNVQGKVEKEEYIIILIIIIFVNEHDSVAKAFLKIAVKVCFFFFSFFLFPFKTENHQSGCPRERMDGEMCFCWYGFWF